MASHGRPRPELAPPLTRRARRELFRADIEGLRAVAVLLVVAYHAGVGVVGGGFVGVDVFFVLSGFLITGLLLDELARTGTLSIANFYARRVRRLLPLSATVLAVTAVAVWVLVPPIDRGGVAGDLAASALWVSNWRFAAESTQYLADPSTSPVLHYWSLAVEEQFYVVWPLVLLLLAGRSGLARRAWSVVARRVGLVLTVVVLASLFLSWALTSSGSPYAYFGLHTRAWELGIGAGLALARPTLALMTRRAARLAGVLGIVLVLGSVLVIDRETPFPGLAALAPVLGTALLVAAGVRHRDGAVTRALSNDLLGYVGRLSYGWYLWHWPVLVLAREQWGDGVAVVGAAVLGSFLLAALSHHLVEQPARQARSLRGGPRRSLVLGAALVASSVAASAVLVVTTPDGGDSVVVAPPVAGTEPTPSTSPQELVAGQARRVVDPAALREPNSPEEARQSREREDKCYVGYGARVAPEAERCRVGPADGERRIALIGDSHANALYPAFRAMADELGWTVYHYGKSGCSVIDARVDRAGEPVRYEACEAWRADVLDRLAGVEPLDAVVIGRWRGYEGSVLLPDGSTSTARTVGPAWTAAAARTFDRLSALTDRVVVAKDVPWADGDVPSCLSENPTDVAECAFPRPTPAQADGALVAAEEAAARGRDDVSFVELVDLVCPSRTCQVVTPTGQIKYSDAHHLSAGYSATLWPELSRRIEVALG
jgi:peptidoglycan/LPS O-acetylase OafA/YrhL